MMTTIWAGYLGLAIAFILLAAMLLWVVISSKGSTVFKAVLIPVAIWYGAVLFFTAQNLMGWPVDQSVPEDSYILAFSVKEPDSATGYPGAILLWASIPATISQEGDLKENDPILALHPKNLFDYQDKNDPRAYRLPYDRKLHKMLMKARESQQGQPGAMIRIQKNENQGPDSGDHQEQSMAMLNIDIVNPLEMLPKKDQ
jgi:hypothetical protein